MAKGKGGKGKGRRYSPNDMRSMALNPNSAHYRAAQANRTNQCNPQHPTFGKARHGSHSPMASSGAAGHPAVPSAANYGLPGWMSAREQSAPLHLNRVLTRSHNNICRVVAPEYTVAYSILAASVTSRQSRGARDGQSAIPELTLVACRKTRVDESYASALETAKAQYPGVQWLLVERSRVLPPILHPGDFTRQMMVPAPTPTFGRGLGGEPRYWAMRLVPVGGLGGADVHVVAVAPYPTPSATIELTRDGSMGYQFLGCFESLAAVSRRDGMFFA